MKFDVLTESWIKVRKNNSEIEVSLYEALSNAHELEALSGEIATQDAAMLRLLLAFLYSIFLRLDENGEMLGIQTNDESLRRWHAIWDLGCFPDKPISMYFGWFSENFDLLDSKKPFMQVPFQDEAVCSDGVAIIPAPRMNPAFIGDIADSGNSINMFARRNGSEAISFAQAARWLVHLNSYDVSPAGAPPRGKKKINKYKHPWPANFDLVYAEGNNLFETLMLNLVLWDYNDEKAIELPKPFWEEPPVHRADDLLDIDQALPKSAGEIYSTLYRQMSLVLSDENDTVLGSNVWSGKKYPDNAVLFYEYMALWEKRKDKDMPSRSNGTKQLWRDFAPLTSSNCGVRNWISELSLDKIVRMRLVNMSYAQDTKISGVFTDALAINASLLTNLGQEWIKDIMRILDDTGKAVYAVGELARNIMQATGGSEDKQLKGERDRSMELAYFALDIPFREWLRGITLDSQYDVQANKWHQTARRILLDIGAGLISEAGTAAFIGREIKSGRNTKIYMSAPRAEIFFRKKLADIFGGSEAPNE
ncbi:MAG: type I-E CRISPR-associated protein Cse1/CasA [Eubacteriaceae bacterium]|nr:type I-E CRISPR-associated protein Cse1/CasA [Eubacteriaceae bacterium]